MRTQPILWLASSASISIVLMAATGVAPAQDAGRKDVQPKADELMRAMSDYLGALPAFKFTADHTTEVVTKDGQKLQFAATSDVIVKRPARLRSDRRGEIVDASFFYDGKTFTVHGKRARLYAVAKAPPTLDEAIDEARNRLELEAPAADLLYSDVYAALMEDVVFGVYAGQAQIDGRTCHHLAFRGSETDWQIWIEAGSRPLPCKYVIVSKNARAAPEFSVELRQWNTAPDIAPNTFTFEPPKGTDKIDFLPAASESRAASEAVKKTRSK